MFVIYYFPDITSINKTKICYFLKNWVLCLPAISSCSFCNGPAQYYCKSCKRRLCSEHIRVSNTIYYCSNCDSEGFDSKCQKCGSSTTLIRHEPTLTCEWCKSSDVEDGLLYHQQLPHLIFSSFNELNRKLSEVWDLTQQYLTVVKSVFEVRKARIMLFDSVEDEITLLRGKISTFIDQLVKFENDTFSMIDDKLKVIGYMRFTNLDNIEKAEEILNLLHARIDLLETTLGSKFTDIENDFKTLNKKVDFLSFQHRLLNQIHSLLPDDKDEHLISIIPRIWLKKNNRLYKKYLLVLTNRNIYFLREKGLFDVKLKSKETLSLSYVVSKKFVSRILSRNMFQLKTRLDSYTFFGRKDSLNQFMIYFYIIENYIDYSIHKSSIIEDLQHYSLTINELKTNIQRNVSHLRAYLLNKRELKRELYWREGQDARFKKLFEQLLSVERKIHRLNDSRKYDTRGTRGIDGLLRKLTREHTRLKQQLDDIRRRSEEFDDMWEF